MLTDLENLEEIILVGIEKNRRESFKKTRGPGGNEKQDGKCQRKQ